MRMRTEVIEFYTNLIPAGENEICGVAHELDRFSYIDAYLLNPVA